MGEQVANSSLPFGAGLSHLDFVIPNLIRDPDLLVSVRGKAGSRIKSGMTIYWVQMRDTNGGSPYAIALPFGEKGSSLRPKLQQTGAS
jgi:hypothetical protein